jgi:hypothetical protein
LNFFIVVLLGGTRRYQALFDMAGVHLTGFESFLPVRIRYRYF